MGRVLRAGLVTAAVTALGLLTGCAADVPSAEPPASAGTPDAGPEPRPQGTLDPTRRPSVPTTLGFDRVERDADGRLVVRHITDR
ncbi:hypothetical protein GC722_10910 [Auraticoccus sp. F435]|uniref:Uncharacterized protein n=1 Tax=Auraticoccus cholistanensis TaxID=2656650 RepID=A0A6A9V161_9ACTN|nr:hypothetical protein [Auraticoccus cholistanensis]MVA76530.1 hypothetical protein [Auraticoccus cholistanensis]